MLAAFAALLPVPSHGARRFEHGLLWRIAGKGGTASHVFGTIHVAEGAGLAANPWEDLKSDLYLGSESFGERLRAMIASRDVPLEIPRVQRYAGAPSQEMILDLILSEFGIDREQLRKGRRTEARLIFATLARRCRAASLQEIGEVLSLSAPGVSHVLRETEQRIHADKRFRERIEGVRNKIDANKTEKRKA